MTSDNLHLQKEAGYAVVQIARAEVLNALDAALIRELAHVLEACDADDSVRCIIITGNNDAFAAGADIREMAGISAADVLQRDQFSLWERIRRIKKPVIAAVSGYALGGGCELAMACDMVIASESARFGQPEINLGIIPGAGGTQRLTRAVGKAKAMEMILSGRAISADEAMRAGLITRVVPAEVCLDEARRLAMEIASKPPLAVRLAKEAILKAFDSSLESGLAFERKSFAILFSTADQKEGMQAFLDKRPPEWKGT